MEMELGFISATPCCEAHHDWICGDQDTVQVPSVLGESPLQQVKEHYSQR